MEEARSRMNRGLRREGSRLGRWGLSGFVAAAIAASGVGAWAAPGPVAVSPGSATGTSIGNPCPTFSWGHREGARSYEVVVYRVGEKEAEGPPVLAERIAASALGWTPPLGRCLEPGERYAWSVRAEMDDGFSGWSDPALFEVVAAPEPDLATALEVVRRHLDATPTPIGPTEGWDEAPLPGRAHTPLAAPLSVAPQAATIDPPDVDAKLTVGGEVRTIDATGEPRLWGQGQPGAPIYGLNFFGASLACSSGGTLHGLTARPVDWGSAAAACPVGTWVCRNSEIGGCDTERPDGTADGRECDGSAINWPADDHQGWVAEGTVRRETGGTIAYTSTTALCMSLPVWCCWE